MNSHEGEPSVSRLASGARFAKKHWRKIALPGSLVMVYGAGMVVESTPLRLISNTFGGDKQVSGLVLNKGRQAATDKSVEPIICAFEGQPCPTDLTNFRKPERNLVLLAQCEDHRVEGGSTTQVCDPAVVYEVDNETYDLAQRDRKLVVPNGSKRVQLDIDP